jgi:hypothetical protein
MILIIPVQVLHPYADQYSSDAYQGDITPHYVELVAWVKRRGQHETSLLPTHVADASILLNLDTQPVIPRHGR